MTPTVLAREELASIHWPTFTRLLWHEASAADDDIRSVGYVSLAERDLIVPVGEGFAFAPSVAAFASLVRRGTPSGLVISTDGDHGVHAWAVTSSGDEHALAQTLGAGYSAVTAVNTAQLVSMISTVVDSVVDGEGAPGAIFIRGWDGEPRARFASTTAGLELHVQDTRGWTVLDGLTHLQVARTLVDRLCMDGTETHS